MLSKTFKKRLAGFTLVEILIASGIFAMFTGGLFAFYRMGSRMFLTGSWKLQRQKEAERFLSLLKERIEQAANATSINPGAATQITTSKCNFLTLNNNTQIANIKANRRIMLFTVAKPETTSLPGG
ncbi:MAG: prepilin-type N-terminal cleavage/methylation domain-containing protein, partial [Candidatus Riflebacteria bacterium]|nr:prepilin-type N-terminal cleavage/methylation domain-containing protein [Candidatus Riflebacteria bacterium]